MATLSKAFDISKFCKSSTKSIDGISTGFNDPTHWVSTGSFLLNKLISNDFTKGIPLGKISVFAGESGSGKSYLCSGNIVKNAQEQGVFVVLVDTENALDEGWLTSLGVDTSPAKLQRVSVSMIDDLAKFTSEFIKSYRQEFLDLPKEDRPQVLFVIDSLGMLMTPTEVSQFQGGDMKGDMGRGAKQRKAFIMNCVNMLGDLNIGLVMTNHTYDSQDMFSPDPKVHGGCLTESHMVTMADGSCKPINNIMIGDTVQTLYGSKSVTETFVFDKPTLTITIGDDNVECSDTHRFLVKKNDEMLWVCAKDLNIDDEIICV